jgi:DNA-binding LytR/AlgR family response regulator
MPTRWLRWFGLWTLLGLVSGVQIHFAHHRLATIPYTWPQALLAGLSSWYLWGALAPVVAWLGRRFQVDRANFGRHFFIHLGASLDLAVLHLVVAVWLQGGGWFAQRFVDAFSLYFHWNVVVYWAILGIVHALDYHRDLEAHRAQARRPQAKPAERLLVADDGRSLFVRTADVEWVEAARNYVRLHTGPRSYVVRTTLAALEAQLDGERFRRTGRSALVNVDRVREVQPWFHGDAIVILESGARVTLSRRYRANLLGAAVP